MFNGVADFIKAEIWKRKLESSGFKIISDPKSVDSNNDEDPDKTGKHKISECQYCGLMTTSISNGLCPHCANPPE